MNPIFDDKKVKRRAWILTLVLINLIIFGPILFIANEKLFAKLFFLLGGIFLTAGASFIIYYLIYSCYAACHCYFYRREEQRVKIIQQVTNRLRGDR